MTTETKAKHKCPPHHFVIDLDNVGHCKYCPEVRDFGKLLRKEGRLIKVKSEHLIEVKSELGSHRKRNKAIYGYGRRGRRPKYA